MGLLGSLASWGSRQLGVSAPSYPLVSQHQLVSLFGRPTSDRGPHTEDRIVSDIWVQPYRGPLDLDRYGGETAEMRFRYRTQYREVPILRAAVRGKADDISVLEPTVLAADKDDALSNLAAEFVKWTVSRAPGGWDGLIDTILTPGMIDGFSLAEKKLELTVWKGRPCWGLAHVRGLDTAFLRLQLDQYRNVLGVVNLVRGLEHYTPDDVILYSHNPMYSNPFGQSDLRAATRAANVIEDVYKVWYIALKVYGLPYMTGKAKPTNKKAMAAAMASLREGGYAVTDLDEDINVINLAAAAATSGFENMVHAMREDIFFAIRGVAQPFMEGDGGANAHTDTTVQQGTSDAGEKRSANRVAEVINRQLIPFLVTPNFDFRGPSGEVDMSRMPRVKLGGTDWAQVQTILTIIEKAQGIGMEISAEWSHEAATMPAPRDAKDKLVSAADKQAQQQQQQMQPAPAAPGVPADPNAAPAPEEVHPVGMSSGAATFGKDSSGHEHKGKGEGGGQFTKGGGANKELPDRSRPKLSEVEAEAILTYTSKGFVFGPLNKALRTTGKPPAAMKAVHKGLQSAFAKAKKFAKPVKVRRGLSCSDTVARAFVDAATRAMRDGSVAAMPGYVSTSSGKPKRILGDSGIAEDGKVKLTIHAVHGLDVSPYSQHAYERELLLNHGSLFRVKSVKKRMRGRGKRMKGLGWHIELEQLPPDSDKKATVKLDGKNAKMSGDESPSESEPASRLVGDEDEVNDWIKSLAGGGTSAATFSAHVEPAVDAVQVVRVVDALIAELMT